MLANGDSDIACLGSLGSSATNRIAPIVFVLSKGLKARKASVTAVAA